MTFSCRHYSPLRRMEKNKVNQWLSCPFSIEDAVVMLQRGDARCAIKRCSR
jgi:hypothetical protein